MLHRCNRRESFIRAHTKPPQSCEERKPAPPDEEQFNAPTTYETYYGVFPYTLQVSREQLRLS